MTTKLHTSTREEKLENLIVNHSMIFMGMFEEAFAEIAEKMTEVLAAGASAMSEALTGTQTQAGSEVDKKLKTMAPEVRASVGSAFSKMRQDMAAQMPKDPDALRKFVSGPEFDKGIEIVDKHDFGLPKITEKLTDETLASYVLFVKGGNAEITKMFKELAEWQEGLPRPPWART